MKLKNLYQSIFVALLLFITTITLVGGLVISYEVKQFGLYTKMASEMKQKVIMLGLLTEEKLAAYAGKSVQDVTDGTEYNFPDAIIPLGDNSELDFVEAIARKTIHQTERFTSSVYDQKEAVLFSDHIRVTNSFLSARCKG